MHIPGWIFTCGVLYIKGYGQNEDAILHPVAGPIEDRLFSRTFEKMAKSNTVRDVIKGFVSMSIAMNRLVLYERSPY